MATYPESRGSVRTPAPLSRVAVIAALSFLLGAVTSYAQGFLPDTAAPLANSASGWTLLTVSLVFRSRLRAYPAAAAAALSFVLLVLGYTVASDLRGYGYNPLIFAVVGVMVGPFVGMATSWLRAAGLRAALGTALLAGIGIGESVYGLSVVRQTTDPAYWLFIGVLSAVFVTAMLVRRIRGAMPIAVALVGAGAIASLFLIAYRGLGDIGV